MPRPSHLADYDSPPLNEVVIGVQFSPVVGYQQIYAGEVWDLYKKSFPKVKEMEYLPPSFETFGINQPNTINFGLIRGPSHDRFWFMAENDTELLQFQPDRFLHNWRKIGDQSNPYPRFETMIANYEKELKTLDGYFNKFSKESIQINQCELTYINHISMPRGELAHPEQWVKFVNTEGLIVDDFKTSIRKTLADENGAPYARLFFEYGTGLNKDNELILLLALTVKGAPKDTRMESAIEFLRKAREAIVNNFDAVTTDNAHKHWKKK